MRADNTIHLLEAATARHHNALQRARVALEELDRACHPITFAAVARAAGVSRSWLYSQAELRAAIIDLRGHTPSAGPATPAAQRATAESLHQRLDAARADISGLRVENAELRLRLAHALGARRAQL